MPKLIRPGEVRVVTQDGEVHVHVTIDLNLTLHTDGRVAVAATASAAEPEKAESPWLLPDLDALPKVAFGKKIKIEE
jgi:hypothetical protein